MVTPKTKPKKPVAKKTVKKTKTTKKVKVVGEVVVLDKMPEMTPAELFFKAPKEEYTPLNVAGQPIVRKGGPLSIKQKEELTNRLFKLAESGMGLNATDSAIAKQIGSDMGINIHRTTIKTYLKDIVRYAPVEEIKQVQFRLEKTYKRLILEASILLRDAKTQAQKTSAINLMANLMERFTSFLENYGRKDKVADKQEILHELANSDIDVKDEAMKMLKELK